jgi:hypothetical protein
MVDVWAHSDVPKRPLSSANPAANPADSLITARSAEVRATGGESQTDQRLLRDG